mgnify:CR=1 FL=1
MTFTSAIKQCYHKAFTLRGRASRSEYWFFCLYLLILCFVLVTIMVFMDSNLQYDDSGLVPNLKGLSILLSGLALFIHIVPMFSVTLRRLHDGNMPGWLLLLSIIPVGTSYCSSSCFCHLRQATTPMDPTLMMKKRKNMNGSNNNRKRRRQKNNFFM